MTQPTNSISDQQLIEHLQAGQHRYFTELSERYQSFIFQKCHSYVKDKDQASDLTQEVLIKVYTELKDFRKEAKFSTWLFAIIHHTCIDFLRRNKRNIRNVMIDNFADSLIMWVEEEEELEKEKTVELMNALLDQLSTEDKLILLLKYKEKHSIQDIVLSMHLSESAVKMRLKRAKEKLNRLYAES